MYDEAIKHMEKRMGQLYNYKQMNIFHLSLLRFIRALSSHSLTI